MDLLLQENKGIEAVAGSYIAFLDSDDTWYPDKIARQVDVLQKNRSAMLVGCLYSIGDRQVFQSLFIRSRE